MMLDHQFNHDLREQVGSAMDTAAKLSEKLARLRGRFQFYDERGRGMTPQQVRALYEELDNLLRGRVQDMISSPVTEAPPTTLDTPL